MSPSEPAASKADEYERVRRLLEERGYLNGRIERFVLQGTLPRGVVRALVVAGAKAALVGGPILGAVLAGAIVLANRPLLAAADGPVLWAYCSAAAVLGLFGLAVASGAITTALVTRRGIRPGDRLRASLIVGLPALTYVALLWWRRPLASPFWEDVAFGVAAAAATLLVAWLGGLVSLAGILGRTGEIPDRARRPMLALAAALVPLTAAGVIAHGLEPSWSERGEISSSAFEPANEGSRLLFVGVDGLDAALVETLASRGALQNLLSRFESGAVFPLHRHAGREPAEIWTTMVCGMGADRHGVRGAGESRVLGVATPMRSESGPPALRDAVRFLLPSRTVPTSGAFRRVRTLWEIAGLKMPVAAVGWWASWPAEERARGGPAGYVVTDRVLPKLLAKKHADRDCAPASLFPQLEARFAEDQAVLDEQFARHFPQDADPAHLRVLRDSFRIDGWNLRVTDLLLEDPAVRAAFVYLPGLDILRFRATNPVVGGEPANRANADAVVEWYVRWLDDVLGRVLTPRTGWSVIVVGDPGRSAGSTSEGFVQLIGPAARAGCVGAGLSALDVTPLGLAVLGFPSSDEMPGGVPRDCVAPPAANPSRVSSFGRRPIPKSLPSADDDPEILERLRSLGYVQ